MRVLIYLALRTGGWVTIRQISESYGISRNHLMKVVSVLTRLGYVAARRGPGGGIKLARPADEIRLADVIQDMEDDMDLVECFCSDGKCAITERCQLKIILCEALAAYLERLESYTVQDLVEPREALEELLDIPAETA
jgi:Rrf2 family nitric oxide-sensitive transcriptional repressor